MRGNPLPAEDVIDCIGSIPARAGEPRGPRRARARATVYPRTCGGTSPCRRQGALVSGLSPHVRGNPRRRNPAPGPRGSIPARAGEPRSSVAGWPGSWVYPRTCGGTITTISPILPSSGLSPHVRGNLERMNYLFVDPGSIPARAGEPVALLLFVLQFRVYPRTCGGTSKRAPPSLMARGLSPHVRGNLGLAAGFRGRPGSIPARAGEPRSPVRGVLVFGVYPRTCGGTGRSVSAQIEYKGLSPHVRGNLPASRSIGRPIGSIPARAGEPAARWPAARPPGVYPRTCGGTPALADEQGEGAGLSPHVRGNLGQGELLGLPLGSIPARAGEPRPRPPCCRQPRVYPRTCGGTLCPSSQSLPFQGLSPHVRGNPPRSRSERGSTGSIPARAGEPFPVVGDRRLIGVYPRTCGGTRSRLLRAVKAKGLSPHVRGNPQPTSRHCGIMGSIPARAGEPCC